MTHQMIVLLQLLQRSLENGKATSPQRGKPNPTWVEQAENALYEENHARVWEIVEAKMAGDSDVLSDLDAASCSKFLGMLAFSQAKHREALGLFRVAYRLGNPDFDVLTFLAYALIRLNRPEEARLHLEASLRLPLSDWEKDGLRDFIENLKFLMSKGRLDAAKCILSQERQMGVLLFLQTGRVALARKSLNQALKEDFEDFQAHNNLGLLEWALGNHEKAWSCFRNCLAIHPIWADALSNAYQAAERLLRLEAFVPLAENALRLDPSHSLAADLLERAANAVKATVLEIA